jgi:hypothetical protein
MAFRTDITGPRSIRPSSIRAYRGSQKRVNRIKMRYHLSKELWVVVAVVLFWLVLVLPWVVRQAAEHPDQQAPMPRLLK